MRRKSISHTPVASSRPHYHFSVCEDGISDAQKSIDSIAVVNLDIKSA